MLWLGGAFATGAHEVWVRHIVCPEHGEIVEVGTSVGEADGPVAKQGALGASHQDGCVLPALPAADLPGVPVVADEPVEPPLYSAPPRAELAWKQAAILYAPKTSPPRSS